MKIRNLISKKHFILSSFLLLVGCTSVDTGNGVSSNSILNTMAATAVYNSNLNHNANHDNFNNFNHFNSFGDTHFSGETKTSSVTNKTGNETSNTSIKKEEFCINFARLFFIFIIYKFRF